MALVVKLLNSGVTNINAATVLYSASSSGLGAIINNIRVVNTGTTVAATVNAFVRLGAGPQIRILDMNKSVAFSPTPGSALVIKPELTLGPTDTIEVTTSAAMDFVVSGVEKQ